MADEATAFRRHILTAGELHAGILSSIQYRVVGSQS